MTNSDEATRAQPSPGEIELYVAGELSGDELEAFELRLLEDPDLLESVQLSDTLREAMREDQVYLKQQMEQHASPRWLRGITPPLAAAAAVVMSVLVGLFMYNLPAPAQLTLETYRGDPVLPGAPAGARIRTTIHPGPFPNASYTVTLMSAEQQMLSEPQQVTAEADGSIEIISKPLPAGAYHWLVEHDKDGTRTEFAFRTIASSERATP